MSGLTPCCTAPVQVGRLNPTTGCLALRVHKSALAMAVPQQPALEASTGCFPAQALLFSSLSSICAHRRSSSGLSTPQCRHSASESPVAAARPSAALATAARALCPAPGCFSLHPSPLQRGMLPRCQAGRLHSQRMVRDPRVTNEQAPQSTGTTHAPDHVRGALVR